MVRVFRLPFLIPNWAAAQVLLPNIIFWNRREPLNAYTMAHELVHIDQIKRMGLLRYWLEYIRHSLEHGHGTHPMEDEARERWLEFAPEAERVVARYRRLWRLS